MYTERLLDHYRNPRNKGRLASPSPPGALDSILAAEEYNPLCGDRITIEACVEQGRLAEVRFEGRGCALCLGAASILTEAIQGRGLDDLVGFGQDEFLAELQSSIRPARLKCALLPWMAFRHAVFGETEWPMLER
jgi:nitrogen fixation NifU-like protein